ncbi:hypothetical protein BGY98DRAFT_1177311 [Russula aff. rugulosa BPL654]|nr:hypothetical protein BGY98DRAFT_1177311 [Russula aff. rugulosa BPL654]
MSEPDFGFLANDNLPSRETIVTLCQAAGYDRTGIPLCNQPNGPIIAWVKYGQSVHMAEALTQDYVARFLIDNSLAGVRVPRVYAAFERDTPVCVIGYIVMQYIDAPDCGEGDYQLVARGPSSVPGPVGGGWVIHNFFVDWTSEITYETVDELRQHINGIIKYMERDTLVDLAADAQNGLYLCPCDITPGNFKKFEDGTVVAIDFGATCFLHPVFFAVTVGS